MLFFLFSLLPLSAYAAMCSGTLDDRERNAFLDGHNTLRSQIAKGTFTAAGVSKPSAANMQAMTWDCSLEASAQAYADTCPDDHSHAPGVGENLYWSWSTAPISITGTGSKSTASWASEFQKYGWANINYDGSGNIGHATQMAWATSNLLGCGVKLCPTTRSQFAYQVNVVCQYKAPGNYRGSPIYVQGSTCSQCPSGSTCNTGTGLCSGGGAAAPPAPPAPQPQPQPQPPTGGGDPEYYYYYE